MTEKYKDIAIKIDRNLENSALSQSEIDEARQNLRRYYNSGDVQWLNALNKFSTQVTGLYRAIKEANTTLQDKALGYLKNDDDSFNPELDDRQIYRLLGGSDTEEGKWWSNLSDEERQKQKNQWVISTDAVKSLQSELRASGDKYASEMADLIEGKSKAEAEHYIRETYNNPTVREMGDQPYQKLMKTLNKDSKVRNVILGKAPSLYLNGNTEKDFDKAFGLEGVLDTNSTNFYGRLSDDQKAAVADANSMTIDELDKIIGSASEAKARDDKWNGTMTGKIVSFLTPRVHSKLVQGEEIDTSDVVGDVAENMLYTVSPVSALLGRAGRAGRAVRTLAKGQGLGGKVTKGIVYGADQAANPTLMEGYDAAFSNDPTRNQFSVADVLQGTLTNFGMDRMVSQAMKRAGANRNVPTIPEVQAEGKNITMRNMMNDPLLRIKNANIKYTGDDVLSGITDRYLGATANKIKAFEANLNKIPDYSSFGRYNEASLANEILNIRQANPNKTFNTIDDVVPYLSEHAKEFMDTNNNFVKNTLENTVYGNPFMPRPTTVLDKPVVSTVLGGTTNYVSNKLGDAHPEMAGRIPVAGPFVRKALSGIRNDESPEEKKARELQERWSVIFGK